MSSKSGDCKKPERIVLTDIRFQVDAEAVVESLGMKKVRDRADEVKDLVAQARKIGKPKAIYRSVVVNPIDDYSISADGITFTSRVLRVNLDNVHRIFPFVATCGVELEAWSGSVMGTLRRYFAEVIKERVLMSAVEFLGRHLQETYQPGHVAMMNPGSLEDWPTSEQKNLFALLGDTADTIGVRLTDSCIMYPIKSVSGILFPAEASFETCRLCPREQCPNRRAPYDPTLFETRYGKQEAVGDSANSTRS